MGTGFPIDLLASAVGAVLVAVALRDVFHTLLHPSGVGTLATRIFRSVWRPARRLGGHAMAVAGPLAVVATIATWALMLVVGWALLYWPHLPEQFHFAPGIEPAKQGSLVDAVYVSAVALGTLGFGDIVAQESALRLALAAEALIGFALLSASISWVLSVYPTLLRRRALTARITTVLEGRGSEARLVAGDPVPVLALVLHGLAEQLATARVDLIQHPASYFFHGPADELSLPAHILSLQAAISRDEVPAEARTAAAAVATALDHFSTTLASGPFGLPREDTLAAYAADHRR